jgi:hypothetical protein
LIVRKATRILNEVSTVARSAGSWADLSNVLFNPTDGLITKAYPGAEQRKAFLNTEEYRQIRALLSDAMDRCGLVEGATPTKLPAASRQ